jgi:hypothetical protein
MVKMVELVLALLVMLGTSDVLNAADWIGIIEKITNSIVRICFMSLST